MTLPQRVLPGTTYLVTRRCLDRRFYLVPSEETNAILLYALAYNAAKHGVEVHAFGYQSNHEHVELTDVRGVRPDFIRDLHRDIAMAMKELHGIPETMWSDAVTSSVELVNEAAQVDAALYILLNPVTAGLVARAQDWPGAVSLPGASVVNARRPKTYFSERRPEHVELRITPPPAWSGTAQQWHEHITEQVAEGERTVAARRRCEGLAVLGATIVKHQRPFDRPRNRDRLEAKRNPVLAAGGDAVALKAAIAGLRAWRTTYREQRPRWTSDKRVAFPPGTWWVVQRAGAVAAA